jgi:transaldolase/glucose-6-phosphate isomerase
LNPLQQLNELGQSIWLDHIRRGLITSGELSKLVEEDGFAGITSSPSVFEKAIRGSTDYVGAMKSLADGNGGGAKALYEQLVLDDVRQSATIMEPVYLASGGRDGFVSLEISPHLACDTQATCEEARRLWSALNRPNVMLKVPATFEGLAAIEQLTSEGINLDVTLLFSVASYKMAAEAFIAGLDKLVSQGKDPSCVASVASFIVSRIDSRIDQILDDKIESMESPVEKAKLQGLRGKVAVANSVVAYQEYKKLYSGPRWEALAREGARSQRLLWTSTSTKNPRYRDVMYVEDLVGADTVTVMPPATYDAFRAHGEVRPTLDEHPDKANDVMEQVAKVGISMKTLTAELQLDGLRIITRAFDKALVAVETAHKNRAEQVLEKKGASLPQDLADKVLANVEAWHKESKVRRLWARDATLWTGKDEEKWLGWLGIAIDPQEHQSRLQKLSFEAKAEKCTHAVVLGMGGSSLCPEVLKKTFGVLDGYPELLILDSTDPAQIRALEAKLNLPKTLFIVASKSGTTLEPNIFKQYFFQRMKEVVGEKQAPRHFVVVTDPGSALEQVAHDERLRRIFHGVPSIGGRYSALSDFGMVPAAVMGIDLSWYLDRVGQMVQACAACVPAQENPGVLLGVTLGTLGLHGRDKVTFITSPGIANLGAWLEQLIAESTGKEGKALIPVDGERPGSADLYGEDRVFVYLRLGSSPDKSQDEAVADLEKAGMPVVRVEVPGIYDIGQEFFRWEIATAVAGSVMGINPFNQPDVEASKIATKKITSEYEATGSLPAEKPFFESDEARLFADEANVAALKKAVGEEMGLSRVLRAHLDRLQPGDYFAILAYLPMNEEIQSELQEIRHAVRDSKKVATCLGFGPRFLHSTGQAYKGGPNTGVFLQFTCDDAKDLQVPGKKYTFGVVKASQARGDFDVLAERKRRVLRVHLGADPVAALQKIRARFENILEL